MKFRLPPKAFSSAEQVTVSRPKTQILIGAVMYLIAVPVLAVMISVMVIAGLYGLRILFNINRERAESWNTPVFLACFLITIIWGIKDFLRRASFQLIIAPDRLAATGMLNKWSCPYDEVEEIRLVRRRRTESCVVKLRSGRKRVLPPDVAGRNAVEEGFNAWLIPTLAGRLQAKLDQGEEIDVRDQRWVGLYHLAAGIVLTISGCFLFLRIDHLPIAVEALRNSIIYVRQRRRGLAGGFRMSSEGVLSRSKGELVPWTEIMNVTEDDAGLVIRTSSGKNITASPYARNFWAAASLLTATFPPGRALAAERS